MFYPEIIEENNKFIDEGNPELADFLDWVHLKAHILGHFPSNLKNSEKLLDWITHSGYMVHPTAIVASFITILSGLTARAVYTETGVSTALYTIAMAPTGSGKDIVTDIPRIIFNVLNREDMVCIHSKIHSEGALDDIFRENNIVVQIIDEFGDQLGQMLSDRSGHLKALMQKYKTLYSSTNGIYESSHYSSGGGKKPSPPVLKIERPNFVLTGITTKQQLLMRLKEEMLYDGFLNRFIIMDGSSMNPWRNKRYVKKEIPLDIKAILDTYISHVFVFKKTDITDNFLPTQEEFLTLKMSPDARAYYHDVIGDAYAEDTDICNYCKDDKTEMMKEVSVRWRENALRFATAISAFEGHHCVEKTTLEWCYNFIKKMSIEFLKAFMDESNHTKQEQNYDKAVLWFKTHHDVTSPWHEISKLPQNARVFKTLKRLERTALIQDLIDGCIIEKSSDEKFVAYKT